MPHKVPAPVGKRFGNLTVIGEADSDSSGRRMIACHCDCGRDSIHRITHVFSGRTKSCGCGRVRSGLYRKGVRPAEEVSYRGMKTRCVNPRDPNYSNYGGRGIGVCQRWMGSLEAFMADMGPRPSPAHSIDRIDVNGHYEPGNCRWATATEQARNQRRNVLDEVGAEEIRAMRRAGMTYRAISEATGLHLSTIADAGQGKTWRALTPRAA